MIYIYAKKKFEVATFKEFHDEEYEYAKFIFDRLESVPGITFFLVHHQWFPTVHYEKL